ncbi:MAG: hypothetical protein AUI16_28730 [Alphaproteobacteria bacterium 13_2_20CM_2_64_7]|jgi:hypothetical protein|nr:MAG: hypothetical protein AUI16_28730 [Alphaproteobacteria bacterium 13_2_20CM_2_64_7]
MAPTDNERRRRTAARFFAVAQPTVATRLQWIEEDAAGFVRLLESGQKTGIADMRRWAKRARFVCHTVFAEPAPLPLDRLIDSRFVWRPLVDDIKRGRPSPAQLFRDEVQRQLASGELPLPPLNAFARDLLAWFVREHPNLRPPKSVRVVERYVRKLWQAARRT